MASGAATVKRVPTNLLIIGGIVAAVLIAGVVFLSRPAPKSTAANGVTPEARAYLPNLELANVTMQATENFMKQQVIEIQGTIANNGPKTLDSVEVTCFFYGLNGQQIHQERVPIVRAKPAPLKPGESRRFRLPFDSIPDGWNQAMPRLVIAGITFANE